MKAVESGTPLSALRVPLKRRVFFFFNSARRGTNYTLQRSLAGDPEENYRPSSSNRVALFACKLLSEKGLGFRKANAVGYRVFAGYFRTSNVATISHGPSVRHSHARWASGEGTDS